MSGNTQSQDATDTKRSTHPQFHRTADLSLLLVAVTWGSSYLAAKEVVTPDTVFGFLGVRFALAAGGLALLVLPRLRGLTRTELVLGGLFGAILSAIFVLETFGVTKTSASNAGLVISLTIVVTPILERQVRKTDLPKRFYLATAVAVLGVILLTQSAGFSIPSLGDALILLAALARAIHVVTISHLSAGKKLDSSRMTLIQLATVLLVTVVMSQFQGQSALRFAIDMTGRDWILTVYLALACTVFGFFVQMWAVRRTSSSRVSLLLGTEPLWAAACGIVLAGDPLTAVGICGGLLILAGTQWGRKIDNNRVTQPAPMADLGA